MPLRRQPAMSPADGFHRENNPHGRCWPVRGRTERMDIGAGGTRSSGDRARPQGSSGIGPRKTARPSGAVAAVFRDRLRPVPLCSRARRAQADRRAGRPGAPGFYDDAVARRVPPQPSFRVPPGLPRLRRLRAGAHRRRAVCADPLDPARPQRSTRGLAGAVLAPRATVEQFRLFMAYQHSRHRDSEMAAMSYARLPRHGRGHRAAHRDRRIPRRRRQARRGVADRPAR